jgi:ABC-type branched-subunit amino acid transport system substrate-binding protein
MTRFSKRFFASCFLVAGPWTLPGLVHAQSDGVFPDKIVLHHVGPLSNSVLAASNKEAIEGANLYFARINAKGGVAGRKVVLETSDDNQDVKKASELTKAVIARDGAIAFFMPRTSPVLDVMIPLVEAAAIPLIAPQVGPDSVTEPPKRHVFAVRASYSAEVDYVIKLQNSFGRTKFAVIGATGSFGDNVVKSAERALAGLSLKTSGIVRVDERNPDIAEAVRVFSASRPDVVIFGCASKCGADFVKAYNQSGNRAQYVALSNSNNSQFVQGLGDQGRGVIVMQVTPSPHSPRYAVSREFKVAAEAAQLPVTYAVMQGWLSARLAVEGLQRAGAKPTPASLTNALESLQNFNMGDYMINYGPKQRAGSQFIEPTMIGATGSFVY